MGKNVLRRDPSRTSMLRAQFVREMTARFNVLRKGMVAYVGTSNTLGMTTNAPFVFATKAGKVTAFRKWLQDMINQHILLIDPVTGEPKGQKPWFYKYVNSAYKLGVTRSYIAAHPPQLGTKQAFYEGTKEQFLQSAFTRPERVDKLQLVYTRAYEDLKGITSQMSTQLSRTLADGLAHGKGPMSVARTMSKTITGITRTRANVLARTEMIHAHAEGQLDGLEDLGVETVEAEVEFSNSDDDGVCKKCEMLNDHTYTIEEARGVIPVHPNCRCAWLPVIDTGADNSKSKKRRRK